MKKDKDGVDYILIGTIFGVIVGVIANSIFG